MIGRMAKSNSGKIVVTIDPGVKRRLHSILALSGLTMKDWVEDAALSYGKRSSPLKSPHLNKGGVKGKAAPART